LIQSKQDLSRLKKIKIKYSFEEFYERKKILIETSSDSECILNENLEKLLWLNFNGNSLENLGTLKFD
jgi:hypothetical protein